MQNRSPEKSQIPGEGVKTRKWRLAWENPALAAALGSICSAGRCHPLFAGFSATMVASDFSRLYIIGFDFRLLSVAAPHDSVAA